MASPTLTIIVPMSNEAGNVRRLVDELAEHFHGPGVTVLLVNNGSVDETGALVKEAEERYPGFIKGLYLSDNLGYGGGIRRAIDVVDADWVCWIPGDLQVRPNEVYQVWQQGLAKVGDKTVIKGRRNSREDGPVNGIVSKIYTTMGRLLFGLPVTDLNALPKIFPTRLVKSFPVGMRKTFVFDTEALVLAKDAGYEILEFPVGWYKRFSGKSSWSNRRFRVYVHTFFDLIKLRIEKIRYGVPGWQKGG